MNEQTGPAAGEKDGRAEALARLPALLLPWYDENKRSLPWRESKDPYRVWVSEIMLQQTRVEAAKEHYRRFSAELPTVADLAACDEKKLFKLWEGLGYYSRARNLQRAARIVAEGGFPRTAQEWKKLPGVGDYTAGAIASIAFEQPSPAVDGNVIRVLARLLGDGREQETLKGAFAAELAPAYPPARRGDFTQSLMELGATVCTPAAPQCLACPLFSLCKTRSDALPRRKEKAARRRLQKTLFLFFDGARLALYRRTAGVLKGTYAFFSAERAMNGEEAAAFLQGAGLHRFALGAPAAHTHVFSHLEWEMTAYPVFTQEDASALRLPAGESADAPFSALLYAEKEAVVREFSLPSAYRWCLALLP